LTRKVAPQDFIDELTYIASNHNPDMLVDVCQAYHFDPKFLVELEYKIESHEKVEPFFVHIYYEKREYDDHVVITVNGYERIQLG